MIKMDRCVTKLQYSGGKRNVGCDPTVAKLIDIALSLTDSNLLFNTLSARLGYSPAQARRVSVAASGENLASFVRRIRLERAAGRLSLTNWSVRDVGREAGYSTGEAFTKAFRAHFDCSAAEFRRLNPTADHLMPGFLLASGASELPSRVRIATSDSDHVTFLYEGPIFLARLMPNGRIDWLPR